MEWKIPELSSRKKTAVAQEMCLFTRGSNRNDSIVKCFCFLLVGRLWELNELMNEVLHVFNVRFDLVD